MNEATGQSELGPEMNLSLKRLMTRCTSPYMASAVLASILDSIGSMGADMLIKAEEPTSVTSLGEKRAEQLSIEGGRRENALGTLVRAGSLPVSAREARCGRDGVGGGNTPQGRKRTGFRPAGRNSGRSPRMRVDLVATCRRCTGRTRPP